MIYLWGYFFIFCAAFSMYLSYYSGQTISVIGGVVITISAIMGLLFVFVINPNIPHHNNGW